MRALLAAAAALCLTGVAASAAEQGCERLAWDLGEERVLLSAAGGPAATPVAPPGAARLALKPQADAGLPKPPERAGRMPGGLAG
ncbi:MAG: hypothetical protein JWR08_1232, partial [Enterovirga sp.]|nr:hypothetical protein [Enterovirga sp.]